VTFYLSVLILVLGCLSCSVATEHSEIAPGSPAPAAFDVAAINKFSGDVALQNTPSRNQNVGANTYRVNFGPQVVTLRASYRDNADQNIPLNGNLPADSLERYFDLRATSALAGTNLLSEGEMAYNLRNSLDENMRPAMLRLGLKHGWRDLSYGADYKSVQKGFTPIGGILADQSRDEAVIWGEHGLGVLTLRGSVGESWERVANAADFSVTRTAVTALQINRARWGGSFSTSYGLTEQGSGFNDENTVLIRKLTTSFRPNDFLLLEPNFSVKEEWNQNTGVKTQTPATGLSFTYSPFQSGFRLTGGTSFSRIFNGDETNDIRMHGTSASLDWRLGRFLGRDDSLSFSFNYNRHLDHLFRSNSHHALSSMLQFKIAGF
jgi:hypothetical protein